MLTLHPKSSQLQVCYYYLPSQDSKLAELIVIINDATSSIRIPVPEEDLELHAFFHRELTQRESERFGLETTWRIFLSWEDLKSDHEKYKVSAETIALLMDCQELMPLQDNTVAA
jgi:hypothetical protein